MRNPNESDLSLNAAPIPDKMPGKKKKKKKGGAFGRFLRRTLLLVFTLVILAAGGLAMLLNTVFIGPSEAARDMLTIYLCEYSATKWIPGIFLGDEKVDEIREQFGVVSQEEFSDAGQVIINTDIVPISSEEWTDYPANEEG